MKYVRLYLNGDMQMNKYIDGKTSYVVHYINEHINDRNDKYILKWLTNYVHDSHAYRKQNWDGSYLEIQPSFPERKVVEYRYYYDKAFESDGKASRLIIRFDDNTEYDIGLRKFKDYCCAEWWTVFIKDIDKLYMKK